MEGDVDLRDHVSVVGEVVTSRRGELSGQAREWRMEAKALRSLPPAHQSWPRKPGPPVLPPSLIVRDAARWTAPVRVGAVRSVREMLHHVEVETPMLQVVPRCGRLRRALQRAHHRPVPADRPGAVPEASRGWRHGARLGAQPGGEWAPLVLRPKRLVRRSVPRRAVPSRSATLPVDTSPLTRQHRSTAGLVEKWDLYIRSVESATAYSELVDPVVQRERFEAQVALTVAGDDEAMPLDEDFLGAMEYGMPPSGGMGMGIDRLLMALTGSGIRETILFPLVRPQ